MDLIRIRLACILIFTKLEICKYTNTLTLNIIKNKKIKNTSVQNFDYRDFKPQKVIDNDGTLKIQKYDCQHEFRYVGSRQ